MKEKMKALVQELNEATEAYDIGSPIMTDQEWDDKYFYLLDLERLTNTILPNSPTIRINGKVSDKLDKVRHNHPMLSLDKTKSVDVVKAFIGSRPYVVMGKMDGLTCSLKYVDGQLVQAETRGDGEVGESVLAAAMMVPSIPKTIDLKGEVVIDGEIICTYKDFEQWSKGYANPRNFAAGSIRLLDNKEVAARSLTFVVWDVIQGLQSDSLYDKLNIADSLGFKTVPRIVKAPVDDDLEENIEFVVRKCETERYPIDGVVIKYDECDYYASLGNTSHHFNGGLALKFYDELYETNLVDIEWTMGRTGSLTPVAIFDMVEIDGCEVTRASLHNVSIMKEVLHGPGYRGQPIKVEKRNEIIPQVAWAANPFNDSKGES